MTGAGEIAPEEADHDDDGRRLGRHRRSPPAWKCAEEAYATGDGCDCGCGAHDPDCDAPGQLAAWGCLPGEACERRLSVYISVQPCHHSSSNPRISCTRGLLEWEARTLRPASTLMEVCMTAH